METQIIKKEDTKTVKVYVKTHRELKIQVATNGRNITEYVSEAIQEKIAREKSERKKH